MTNKFKVGDRVTFDGSGDRTQPRPYTGTIEEVRDSGLLMIRTDEWWALCAVAPSRVRHLQEGGA